jgi:ribokinase
MGNEARPSGIIANGGAKRYLRFKPREILADVARNTTIADLDRAGIGCRLLRRAMQQVFAVDQRSADAKEFWVHGADVLAFPARKRALGQEKAFREVKLLQGARVTILGIFVADLAFRAKRLPVMGETILGNGFALGPGGKGSNQSVAAAKSAGPGRAIRFITKVGQDPFGDIGIKTWADAGVDTSNVIKVDTHPTGAAFIFVSTETGNNAIIVESGAAGTLSIADVEAAQNAITSAQVFITQLEQPIPVAHRALEIARKAGVTTVFNPAPAAPVSAAMLALCDYVTPNESEAATLTGLPVDTLDQARQAADKLLSMGVKTALITLGEKGALLHDKAQSVVVPAFKAGAVVDTTGAGDAFNGGFAVALAEGRTPIDAVRFGCAVAGISVTRPGTAPSMPTRAEIEALLSKAS